MVSRRVAKRIEPVEEEVAIAQANLFALSDEIRGSRKRKIVMRNGSPDLVVLSAVDYEELIEGLDVANALLAADADIAAGRTHTDEEVQAFFRERIEAARRTATESVRGD